MTSKVWDVMNDLEMVTSKVCSAREMIDVVVESIQNHDHDRAESMANAAYEFLGYYLEEFDAKFKLAWKETVVAEKKVDDGMRPWGHSDIEYQIANKELPRSSFREREYYEKTNKTLSCDKNDSSPECRGAWNDFWEEHYYPEEAKEHSEFYYDYTRNDPDRKNPFEIAKPHSDKFKPQNGVNYNQYVKAKIETNSAWNDGWTKEYYQKIVDKYEGKQDKVKKWVLPVEKCKDADTDETEYFVSFPDDLLEAANLKEGDPVEWIDQSDGSYLLKKVEKPMTYDEMISAGYTMTSDGFWIKEPLGMDEC